MRDPTNCPKCDANLVGKEIAPQWREHYGNRTHYTLAVAVYDSKEDRTTGLRCPFCGHEIAKL